MGYGYPQYQDQLGEIDLTMVAVQNYCLAALCAIYVLLDFQFLARLAVKSPTIIFGLLILSVTIIGSDDPVYSSRTFLTTLLINIPIVAYSARFGVDRTFELFCRFWHRCDLLDLLYVIVFLNTALWAGIRVSGGMLIHKNGLGPFMAIAVIIVLPRLKRFDVVSVIAAIAVAIAVVFVALSRSASAWVMLGVTPLVYFTLRLILFAQHRVARRIVMAGFLLGGCGAIIVIYFYLFDSILEILGRDPTLTNRTTMWRVLFDIMQIDRISATGSCVFSSRAVSAILEGVRLGCFVNAQFLLRVPA